MNSQPDTTLSPLRLPGFGFVNVEGPDAGRFLQSQLSSDLRTLADGDGQWSALLNPQGRVIVFFGLCRLAEQRYRMLMPTHAVDATISHLRRFQLRSKLRLDPDPTPAGGGWVAAGPAPAGSLVTASRWFGEVPSGAREPDPEALARWALADIDEGLTWLSADQREQFVAQMLGLEQLGAISLRKGCYPGQEIVARAHFRGAVKRRLVRLRLNLPVSPGDPVERASEASDCGVVLSSAGFSGEFRALAVLAADQDDTAFRVRSATSPTVLAERY